MGRAAAGRTKDMPAARGAESLGLFATASGETEWTIAGVQQLSGSLTDCVKPRIGPLNVMAHP